jgi:hypothetical protein
MEFGTRSAARIWCMFMGLVACIVIHVKNICDLLHYINDAWSYDSDLHLYWYEPYSDFYPAKQVQLLCLWDEISLPHEKSKQVFGKTLCIIGLDVDPSAMLISFPTDAKASLVVAIHSFTDTSTSRRPLCKGNLGRHSTLKQCTGDGGSKVNIQN